MSLAALWINAAGHRESGIPLYIVKHFDTNVLLNYDGGMSMICRAPLRRGKAKSEDRSWAKAAQRHAGMNQNRSQPLRVIQCGTGVAGRQALRAILGNPSFDLVGLLVHSQTRCGERAAVIAGVDSACTVQATTSFKDILRIEADAVCYMMLLPDVEKICALLVSCPVNNWQ